MGQIHSAIREHVQPRELRIFLLLVSLYATYRLNKHNHVGTLLYVSYLLGITPVRAIHRYLDGTAYDHTELSLREELLLRLYKECTLELHPPALQRSNLLHIYINNLINRSTWTADNGPQHRGYWFGTQYKHSKDVQHALKNKAAADDVKVLLYIHGGGFMVGSARDSAFFLRYIQQQYNQLRSSNKKRSQSLAIYSLDYTLSNAVSKQGTAPQTIIEECITAYKWLIQDVGVPASNIIIGGDSSGGNITLSTILQLPSRKLPSPAAGVLISPWVDLSKEYLPDEIEDESRDYLNLPFLDHCALTYLGNRVTQDHPITSPLYANLDSDNDSSTSTDTVPPLFVCYGGREILRGQCEALVEKLRDNRIHVSEVVDWRLYHNYILYGHLIGRAAWLSCDELVTFMKGVYSGQITNESPSETKVMDSW